MFFARYTIWLLALCGFSAVCLARPVPIGIVGEVEDTEIFLMPELSGALLRASNLAVLPSRLTTSPEGELYVLDNDQNDELSGIQALAFYDRSSDRTGRHWRLHGSGGVLRDALVLENETVYLLDKGNKTIEKQDSSGALLATIPLGLGSIVSPDTLAIDSDGNFYVLDKGAAPLPVIYKYDPSGAELWDSTERGLTAVDLMSDLVVAQHPDGSEALYVSKDYIPGGSDVFSSIYRWDVVAGPPVSLPEIDTTSSTHVAQHGASRLAYSVNGNDLNFYVASNRSLAVRARQASSPYSTWSRIASGGAQSQWNLDEDGGRDPAIMDVAALSLTEVYIVDANYGLVRELNTDTADNNIELDTTDPLGDAEDLDETLRNAFTEILGDSSNTTGINYSLLAYDNNDLLKVYGGDADTLARLTNPLLPADTAPGDEFELDEAVNLAGGRLDELLATQSDQSCLNSYLLYLGPGDWDDRDYAIGEFEDLIRHKGYSGVKPVGYNLGESDNDPARASLLGLANAVSETALFPATYPDLVTSLSEYLQEKAAVGTSVTANPSLTSGVLTYDLDGDSGLLKLSFNYYPNSLWRGHVRRFDVNGGSKVVEFFDEDDNPINALWNAGERLSLHIADGRNLWTAYPSPIAPLNNFHEANAAGLNSEFHPDLTGNDLTAAESRTTQLINYIRGKNPFNEEYSSTIWTEKAWKLGDSNRQQPVIVAAPNGEVTDDTNQSHLHSFFRFDNGYESFRTAHENRSAVIYTPANDGVLHAFDFTTGEELWGFVPPPLLSKFTRIESSEPSSSRAIFGIDATPVTRDVFVDGQWKTILMGGLGRGGAGFYALDITDPEAPRHLFSISNDSARREVIYWASDGTKTVHNYAGGSSSVPADWDYTRLGQTWSQPIVVNITYGGVRRDVAVMAAGYNNKTSPDTGNAVYIIDLDEGSILQQFLVDDQAGDNIVNAVPASPVAVSAQAIVDGSQTFTGVAVYVGDLEGQIWKLDLTGQIAALPSGQLNNAGSNARWRKLYDGQATADNGRYIFHRIAPTINRDRELLLTFGTGDADQVSDQSSMTHNYFAGVVDMSFLDNSVTTSTLAIGGLENVTDQDTARCPIASAQGWRFDLDTGERLLADSDINGVHAVFTSYQPGLSSYSCTSYGSSNYTELDIDCGTRYQRQNLGYGLAGGVNFLNGQVYIAVTAPEIGAFAEQVLDNSGAWTRTDGIVTGTPTDSDSGRVVIELWQQIHQ